MVKQKRQILALNALNYDLFRPESITPPAPATLHTRMREQQERVRRQAARFEPTVGSRVADSDGLPSLEDLYRLFDLFNWSYFDGRLPRVAIEYSRRMTCAGSYTPHRRLIKIGRRYHRLFPAEIEDTLKHEMIHIMHFRHDAAFKAEAGRIGASVRAKSHPSLRRPPRYVYACGSCGREFPRQKPLRMSSCGYCSAGGRFDPRFKLKLIKGPVVGSRAEAAKDAT